MAGPPVLPFLPAMPPTTAVTRPLAWLGLCGALWGVSSVAQAGPGRLIYPDFAGASRSCVLPVAPGTQRIHLAAGARLVLRNCPRKGNAPFVVAQGRITLVGQPQLCVGVAPGTPPAQLAVVPCATGQGLAWQAPGTAIDAAPIRAVAVAAGAAAGAGAARPQCWAIPQLGDPKNPLFPYPVLLQDCGREPLALFVE